MQLQYETQDQVPEDLRESFVEFNEGDKTLFMHKDLAETKKEFYRTKGDLTHAQKAAQEKAERLKALEDAEVLRQQEREQQELESKKKNGQHEEILEFERLKWQKEREELLATTEQLKNEKIESKIASAVSKVAVLATDLTRKSLEMHARNDIKPDENGELVVHLDGKATSLTIDEYCEKAKELYPHLVREVPPKGGLGKGNAGSVSPLGKKPKDMTSAERIEFKQRDPDGFKRAFNL